MPSICGADCDNCEYGPNDDNPELIIYKKNKQIL